MKPHFLKNLLVFFLEIFCVGLVFIIILIVSIGVFGRLFDLSVPWYDEVANVFLVWLTYFGSSYVMLKRGHMGFDGLLILLKGKWKKVLFFFEELVVMAFFMVSGYFGWDILKVFSEETLITLPFVRLSLTQSVIPISSLFFISAQILTVKEAWKNINRSGYKMMLDQETDCR